MILPMCCEDSISACAAAASASGNTRWTTGFTLAALEQRPDLLAQRIRDRRLALGRARRAASSR